jgi:polyvinyl alcohol dehydrogenase (cytochrome)
MADERAKTGLHRHIRMQCRSVRTRNIIPGVAFLGSWDGHIRAYETKAGAIIWDFDTAQEFQTVNGVRAHGGSIVSMAPVVAGGTLYMTSGYSGNAMPGNLLLAFTVEGK